MQETMHRTTREGIYVYINTTYVHTYKNISMHEWAHTFHTHISRLKHRHKVVFLNTPLSILQNKKLTIQTYTHSHASIHMCTLVLQHVSLLQGLIWWQPAVYPAARNIHAINKCSIINKPQNGSNCSVQPNASISIPRTFLEQPELFLITASYLGKKRLLCRIFPVLLGFRGQTSAKNPQRLGVVITILAKLPLIF